MWGNFRQRDVYSPVRPARTPAVAVLVANTTHCSSQQGDQESGMGNPLAGEVERRRTRAIGVLCVSLSVRLSVEGVGCRVGDTPRPICVCPSIDRLEPSQLRDREVVSLCQRLQRVRCQVQELLVRHETIGVLAEELLAGIKQLVALSSTLITDSSAVSNVSICFFQHLAVRQCIIVSSQSTLC